MTLAAETISAQNEALSAGRRAMIDSQLRVSGINQDWLLARFARVAREDFVPVEARGHAYIDRAIPAANGRAIPAPLAQAMLLAEATPRGDDKVLVISDSGYLAALVEPLLQSVETVDASAALGLQAVGGFTLVLIDGAVEQVPANLTGALSEGGRLVAGLSERGVTRLAADTKQGNAVVLTAQADVGFPVLREFAAPKTWSF
ncbi:MAG: protein-L-isoaspartate O-methyltransferase family protein [Novosphingobium sp.]